jgi:hypothetical protein
MAWSDELWKETIEKLFPQFIEFFHKEIYNDLDLDKGYVFLDKEFQSISSNSDRGKGYVDKLVKVYLKNGEDRWILIHIEVQGYRDEGFAKRMFRYFYRIYDKYDRKILTIAILTDSSKNYHPSGFIYNFYDTHLNYSYRTYKVIEQSEEELSKNENPFALAILAALHSIKAKNNEEMKLKFKLKLVRMLLKRGYGEKEIIEMFRFIDGVIKLNDIMKEKLFKEELLKIEEVKRVPYITSIERLAKEEGEEKGIRNTLEKLLVRKFGNLDKEILNLIETASDKAIDNLIDSIFDLKELSEAKKILKEQK